MTQTFNGYQRADGSVGIRNKLLIAAVDECADGVCRAIARSIPEAVVITNVVTCMMAGNEELLANIIGCGNNPNVGAVLVVAMGCGSIDPEVVAGPVRATGKPVDTLKIMACGGSKKAIAAGTTKAKSLEAALASTPEVEADLSRLVVGVKCGGSDTSSGLASNPTVGVAVDHMVDQGATVIGGELIELIGGEPYLTKRMADPAVKKTFLELVAAEEKRWNIPGAEVEIMSVGNSTGGLTTIEEKTLGAISKFGSRQVVGVLKAGPEGIERPDPGKPGLYISEATHLCGASAVNFAAMGCQLILWTSGGAGFNNPMVPVIRVSGNPELITEDQDIDATPIMRGEATSREIGAKLIQTICEVACGAPTAIEEVASSFMSIYQKEQRLESCLALSGTPPCKSQTA
ncbi:UxaA family hydrolase [Desulfoluna butyratoxydans]|uniref:D-galactarate/altronate dehydratase c-terminal n=1 Tax=Desulfoluna butyratoxydans TaxID=231438 RepID=A0A4U8YHM3_9BACT|nr:UxaA family hydrolase [Desulfoluna butyratoxydans]VFQ43095.1 d-galactarate/altronate dehydratase c-terminal [Desulfoluna butyratoxydans]